jgi:hypothetical protein
LRKINNKNIEDKYKKINMNKDSELLEEKRKYNRDIKLKEDEISK